MATINPTVKILGHNTVQFTYVMANGDDGAWIGPNHAEFTDRNVSARGTPGVGFNLQIQGSDDDGVNASPLNDAQGSALDIATLPAREQILEVPEQTRPNITGGDGTTDVTVVITVTRPRSGND